MAFETFSPGEGLSFRYDPEYFSEDFLRELAEETVTAPDRAAPEPVFEAAPAIELPPEEALQRGLAEARELVESDPELMGLSADGGDLDTLMEDAEADLRPVLIDGVLPEGAVAEAEATVGTSVLEIRDDETVLLIGGKEVLFITGRGKKGGPTSDQIVASILVLIDGINLVLAIIKVQAKRDKKLEAWVKKTMDGKFGPLLKIMKNAMDGIRKIAAEVQSAKNKEAGKAALKSGIKSVALMIGSMLKSVYKNFKSQIKAIIKEIVKRAIVRTIIKLVATAAAAVLSGGTSMVLALKGLIEAAWKFFQSVMSLLAANKAAGAA